MNLDKLQIDASIRSGWQAVDLGFLMARAWFRELFAAGLLAMLPLALVLLAVFHESPFWALFILWWLKPFWERLPLYIASRRLFGERVGVWQSLKSFPLKDVWPWLLWRRFSVQRAFDNPVTVLEELRSGARRRRLQVLHGRFSDVALGNQFTCFCFEILLCCSLVLVLVFFIPEDFDPVLADRYGDPTVAGMWIWTLAGIGAMALVMPFHPVGGFSLSLNRRIELEAWDIEISFRNLTARKRASSGGPAGLLASLLAALVLTVSAPGQLQAATEHDRESAAQAIEEVLAGPDYGQPRRLRKWRFRDWSEEVDDELIPEWMIDFFEWWEEHADWSTDFSQAAFWIKILLVILFGALLVYLVRRYRGPLSRLVSGRRPQAVPEMLFGLDVTPESLPEDVPGQVLELWREGNKRDALGLLYRASLSRLIERYEIAFRASHTEAECAALVKARGIDSLSAYFQQLTDAWRRLAYGHQAPAEAMVERLCADWRSELSNDPG